MASMEGPRDGPLDLAVIGAGAAGTWVAHQTLGQRPDWSIGLFERSSRIGGRLRSMHVPGLEYPIELGGMRYTTSHIRVQNAVATLGLPTHPFDLTGGAERSYLRGSFGTGPDDPEAGAGYDLPPEEQRRSASRLLREAFERIVPGASALDADAWVRTRASAGYRGRPLTDWTMGDALGATLSPEGHRFVADAFGYDSGLRAFNAGDSIEYLLGGGDPDAVARTPDDGMDAIPRGLAAGFAALGGTVRLDHELIGHRLVDGAHHLQFANGAEVTTRRVVLALALPALRMLAEATPVLASPPARRILESAEPFPATKLYLWFDHPWWRSDGSVIRLTTDRPSRKLFYFETATDGPAAMLAAFTDGLHTEPWVRLADGAGQGSPASDRMLARALAELRTIHPGMPDPPPLSGSAFCHWGADPHETGWTFWRPGVRSDEIGAAAIQPDPSVDLFVCGESFSRAQAWVEGALETADAVVGALTVGR